MLRTTTYSLGLCAVAAVAFWGGYEYSPHESVAAADAQATPERTPRRVLHYRDPMHPAYTSDAPGTAPDCGMALEPVYADGHLAAADAPASDLPPGAIVLSRQRQQMIGVRVEQAHESAGTETRRVFGRVAADETRVYRITAGLAGYIRHITPRATGHQVRKGERLASFAAPEARTPFAGYIQMLDIVDREVKGGSAPQQVAAANHNLNLAADRLLTAGASPVQLEEIRKTRQVPRDIEVASPADGVLLARNITAGQQFDAGTELFRVADLRRVWVIADIPAAAEADIRPGMSAQINIPGSRVRTSAHVSRTIAPFDPATQSIKIRLEADNPELLLRPDMFVDVDFALAYEPSIVIPAEAVVAAGIRNVVFVEHSPGVFVPRVVQLGRRHGDRITVLEGLSCGDRIAVSGTFLLDSETRMNGHDQPHH